MLNPFRTKRPAAARTPITLQRLCIGHLEDRSLPSVSATLFDGTLYVTGSLTGPKGDQIRITGDVAQDDRGIDLIRVFDGEREIGEFAGVKNIAVRPGGNSTTSIDLNAYAGVSTLDIFATAPGTNIIAIGEGAVQAVSFTGGEGSEIVSVNGLNAQAFDADTGAGSDHVRFGAAAIGQLGVRSAESVFLNKTAVDNANLDNRGGTMVVDTTAAIAGKLRVLTGTGSLRLGGIVGGNVEYLGFGFDGVQPMRARVLPDRAELIFTGQVGGALRMATKDMNDTAYFASTSSVAGNVQLALGGGNDSVTLGGAFSGAASTLFVDLGEGNDSFTILDTARITTTQASVNLGAGDDYARVEVGAQFLSLYLDGGEGHDMLQAPGMEKQIVFVGFEGIQK